MKSTVLNYTKNANCKISFIIFKEFMALRIETVNLIINFFVVPFTT